MTKRVWANIIPLFLLGCLLAVAPPAGAADEKKESPEDKAEKDKLATEAADSVRQIGMALQLADYGRKEKSPEMLISAARILRWIEDHPGTDEPKAEGGDAAKKKSESLHGVSDKLLKEAREMAGEDKTVLELADRVANLKKPEKGETSRGALGGPRSYHHFPGDGTSLTWNVRFRVGIPASVTVRGDGYHTLTTTVQGPGGYYYQWTGRNASTNWVPGVPGLTTITVVNNGPGACDYTMYHN
jgi:hypothetical protein